MGHEFAELIRVLSGLANLMEREAAKNKQVNINISLKDKLTAAASPNAKVKVLGEIAEGGFAGYSTRRVRSHLKEYTKENKIAENLWKKRIDASQKIQALKIQKSLMKSGGQVGTAAYNRRKAISDKISRLNRERAAATAGTRSATRRAARALSGATSAAQEGLGVGGSASLIGVVGKLNVAVAGLTAVYRVGREFIASAHGNVQRYGAYSWEGAHAKVSQNLGEMYRKFYMSSETAPSMTEFVKQENRMKNAWAPIQSSIDNFINRMGAFFSGKAADVLEIMNRPGREEELKKKDPALHARLQMHRGEVANFQAQIDAIEKGDDMKRLKGRLRAALRHGGADSPEYKEIQKKIDELSKPLGHLKGLKKGAQEALDAAQKEADKAGALPEDAAKEARKAWMKQFENLPKFGLQASGWGGRGSMPMPEGAAGMLPPGSEEAMAATGGGIGAFAGMAMPRGAKRSAIVARRRKAASAKQQAEAEVKGMYAKHLGHPEDETDAEKKARRELEAKIREYQNQIHADSEKLKHMPAPGHRGRMARIFIDPNDPRKGKAF